MANPRVAIVNTNGKIKEAHSLHDLILSVERLRHSTLCTDDDLAMRAKTYGMHASVQAPTCFMDGYGNARDVVDFASETRARIVMWMTPWGEELFRKKLTEMGMTSYAIM